MTKKEKKAIENIDKRLTIEKYTKNIATPVYISDLETILNLIQSQQKLINLNNEAEIALNNRIIDLEEKLKNKDKIINEMAEWIYEYITIEQILNISYEEGINMKKMLSGLADEEVTTILKQYFEKKVEGK